MTGTTVARIPRDVVVVSGPDATSFLQSLVSQDLDPVAVGAAAHTLLLAPQGKLVADLRAARVAGDEWWCVCEGSFGERLAEALRRFRIRVEVEIDDRASTTGAIAVHGSGDPLPASVADGAAVVSVPVPWPGSPGIELAGDTAAIDQAFAAIVAAGATRISDDDYEVLRIEAGIPRQGYDIDESTIAQEAYLERDAVSFTKGCFVGQELVCRIDTRGHVNRHLRRLRSDHALERHAVVVAGEREVGAVTSAVGRVALAMLRREVEPGSTVTVRTAGGDVPAGVESVVSD